jgi:hypothetical protein
MLFPLYVTADPHQLIGRSPLVPDFSFKGANVVSLAADVRNVLSTIAAAVPENPHHIIATAEGYEGGEWVCVFVGEPVEDNPTKRVNISFPARLIDAIDQRAEEFGLTRSGWLAHAARAQLAKGG